MLKIRLSQIKPVDEKKKSGNVKPYRQKDKSLVVKLDHENFVRSPSQVRP